MDRLRALSEAFRAFVEATADYPSLLVTIARELVRLLGDGCIVALVDDDGAWEEHSTAHARDPEIAELLLASVRAIPVGKPGTGLAATVARSGEPILLPEVDLDALAARADAALGQAVITIKPRSYLAVPLEVRGKRLGAVAVMRYAADAVAFDRDDLVFARNIADHAALAIANAKLVARLQRELEARERVEERSRTLVGLVENSTDMIALAGLDGRVKFVNAAGRALVGIAPDRDVTELTLADFHTEDGLKRGDIIRATGSWQGKGVLKHFVSGELIPTQVSSFLARDTDGKPFGYATVQHDLRETQRLENELRQAQRMEALGRLAGGIAHDFNNLLTVILSYAAILTRSAPVGSRTAHDIAQIERAGTRAAGLTRQLLAFSRQQVLAPTALDLGESVRAMAGMIRPLIGEDIELAIATPPDLGMVIVDAGQVEQVVMNLVVNARDAMGEGGVLSLDVARVEVPDARARELGLDPGVYNVLVIADTGTGIDEATRAHLFEPFFTTKPRGKGTGLGLSTVMGIVKQSGGNVTVDSTVGKGTTFRVYLPCVPREPEAASPAPARPSTPAIAVPRTLTPVGAKATAERIFVVEDEDAVRTLVAHVLRKVGYEVVTASDGEQALALASTLPPPIALLLTDVIMPRLSGPQLVARFHEHHPETRVLFMSGYTDDKLGHHGILDPGVELIQKPLTPEILVRRVREMLD